MVHTSKLQNSIEWLFRGHKRMTRLLEADTPTVTQKLTFYSQGLQKCIWVTEAEGDASYHCCQLKWKQGYSLCRFIKNRKQKMWKILASLISQLQHLHLQDLQEGPLSRWVPSLKIKLPLISICLQSIFFLWGLNISNL